MRVEGWESLLNRHIEDARGIVFEWGVNDCALWCADWVRKATGQDFAATWRGRYTSEEELKSQLHAMGLTDPAGIADEVLQPVETGFAKRGDIVQHPHGHLGICNGVASHFLMERGVTRVRTRDCTKAWKVG
jgi:hypothetical protein